MDFSVDHFFAIGKTHKVCEDYALSGSTPFPYLIVADGCSSSPHTDIGARILSHIARNVLITCNRNVDYKGLGGLTIGLARQAISSFGLPYSCLDSTLLVAFEKGKYWIVFVYGDGSIIWKREGSPPYISSISYSQNMPYYLSYWSDPARREVYKRANVLVEIDQKNPSGGECNAQSHQFNYDFEHLFMYENSSLLILCTDGIESFVSTKDPSYQYLIANFLMNIKTTKGEFIKRRASKMLKTLSLDNVYPMDDFSVAAYARRDYKCPLTT